jgi:hypothetical protein
MRLQVGAATPSWTGAAAAARQKVGDAHRQRAIDVKLLRHIRHGPPGPVGDDRALRRHETEDGGEQVVLPEPLVTMAWASRETVREVRDRASRNASKTGNLEQFKKSASCAVTSARIIVSTFCRMSRSNRSAVNGPDAIWLMM